MSNLYTCSFSYGRLVRLHALRPLPHARFKGFPCSPLVKLKPSVPKPRRRTATTDKASREGELRYVASKTSSLTLSLMMTRYPLSMSVIIVILSSLYSDRESYLLMMLARLKLIGYRDNVTLIQLLERSSQSSGDYKSLDVQRLRVAIDVDRRFREMFSSKARHHLKR